MAPHSEVDDRGAGIDLVGLAVDDGAGQARGESVGRAEARRHRAGPLVAAAHPLAPGLLPEAGHLARGDAGKDLVAAPATEPHEGRDDDQQRREGSGDGL
ncbi:MAG: hypothetical protein LWW86_05075 [Micrococcales bacterium]|nr:hypothetical protein [Micrococcales bacterium]